MRHEPDRLNRVLLTIFAVAAIALSVWGIGRAAGWFGADDPDEPLLLPRVADFVARNAHWFWPLAVAVAVLCCVLALVWLRAQLRLPRRANTDLVARRAEGDTRVEGGALAGALQEDVVGSVEAVRRASARVVGDHEDVDIDLRVELGEIADVDEVRLQIESEVLPRFTRAAGVGRSMTYLDLRVQPGTRHLV